MEVNVRLFFSLPMVLSIAFEAVTTLSFAQTDRGISAMESAQVYSEQRKADIEKARVKQEAKMKSVPLTAAGDITSISRDRVFESVKTATNDLGGGVKMEMVWVPAGEFDMGSNDYDGEKPVHHVKLTKGFWMGKYEVTNGQYKRFLADSGYDGSNEADGDYQKHFRGNSDQPIGAEYPMIWVSWNNAQAFCRWLSQKVNGTVRLPTEAEWEYACRAGTSTRFHSGNADGDMDGIGWCRSNSGAKAHPVGRKQANAWGLHDMSGNVWEWCQDWYGTYSSGSVADPVGTSSGSGRVLRGGSWKCDPVGCRSAYRINYAPSSTDIDCGFRVVCVR
jgi:formylglycine-generating enzyme required for sulfatase activity